MEGTQSVRPRCAVKWPFDVWGREGTERSRSGRIRRNGCWGETPSDERNPDGMDAKQGRAEQERTLKPRQSEAKRLMAGGKGKPLTALGFFFPYKDFLRRELANEHACMKMRDVVRVRQKQRNRNRARSREEGYQERGNTRKEKTRHSYISTFAFSPSSSSSSSSSSPGDDLGRRESIDRV